MATWMDVGLMAINALIWVTAAYLLGREHGMSLIVGDWMRAESIREKRGEHEQEKGQSHQTAL